MEDVKRRAFLAVENGYGDGSGSGYGSSDGYGYGYGSGDGSGYGDGITYFWDMPVDTIDKTATILTAIFGNYAKGFILRGDLTLEPCYVAKDGAYFAHGKTLAEAVSAAHDKAFEDMSEEERIEAFWDCHNTTDAYPACDLYDWHHRLTGSCEMGRNNFAAEHGIDIDTDEMTVPEFIRLTQGAYGGEIIRKLEVTK